MSGSEEIDEFNRNNVDFAFDLYTKVTEQEEPDNVIISPFGVQIGATLAFLGAVGDTAKEMMTGLRLQSDDTTYVVETFTNILESYENSTAIHLANKMYVSDRYVLNTDFSEIIAKELLSDVESIDFLESGESAALINMWFKERTQNKITDIVEPDTLDEATSSILVNAVYLKAKWEHPFAEGDSFSDDFWINETESIENVFMINRTFYKYKEIRDDFTGFTVEAVDLPFKDCNLSMLILLPALPQDITKLDRKLLEMDLGRIRSEMVLQEVHVKIPRFQMEFSVELKKAFKKMGMKKLFTAEAEFDKILEEEDPLFIQKIIHKTLIEVNEAGDEMAEATDTHEMFTSPDFPIFTANRPFIYMVVDEKTNILLLGKFFKPKSEQETEQE